MEIKILKNPIKKEELKKIAEDGFGDMVKAVVDIKKGVMAIGGEFHSEEEALLIEQAGAEREHTWGINLYPDKAGDDFIEFDSMVNTKPAFGNRSRKVESAAVQKEIRNIIANMILKQ